MARYRLTVALLLVSGLVWDAAAGDDLNKPKASKKAKALYTYLEKLGLNTPEVRRFTETIEKRREGDFIRLTEERFDHGRVVLFYELEGVSSEHIVLKYQPDNSNYEYVASQNGIMMNYSYKF